MDDGCPISAPSSIIHHLSASQILSTLSATAFPPPRQSVASPVFANRPPDPVEELPPDQKPDGDNVLWISGYWDWDEEDKEFIAPAKPPADER